MEKSQNRKPFQALRDLFRPVDLTHGTCWRTILQFSLPVILSYLLQQVYTISDAAIVGQTLTAQEVAGVNDTTSLVFIFLQFAFGVSAGFCVITSCCVGCRDQAGVRRSMAAQLVLSAGLTVLLTALALVLLNPMLAWINVTPENPEVYRAAYTYCGIIFAGIGAQLFYNFICSFLRSMGDSVTPLLFLLGSTVLNVALDLLFILVLHWGVAGAAGATVTAQLISTVACFAYAFPSTRTCGSTRRTGASPDWT
ncbi:MAG: MATE family efflux transporter [Oscillospiraceae bacterium]